MKIFYSLLIFFIFIPISFAETIRAKDLLNNASKYDNKLITYEGEIIGDILKRGKWCCINVNDGEAAIGVWLECAQLKDVKHIGRYKAKGDWLEIYGKFYQNCPKHGGDLDIHALEVKILKEGEEVKHYLPLWKIKIFIALAIILLVEIIIILIKFFFNLKFKKR